MYGIAYPQFGLMRPLSGAVTAAVVGGTIAAGAGIAGSAISSSAAGKAASAQASAADQAAQLQYQASQNALDFQKQQYATSQQQQAPWLKAGSGAINNLSYLLGVGGQPQASSNVAQGTNTPFQASTGNTSMQLYNPNGTGPINAQSNAQMANPGLNSYSPDGSQQGQQPTFAGTLTPGQGTQNVLAQPGLPADSGVNPSLGGYGSLMTPYAGKFEAPTDITMQNDPGYQARLKLGTDVLQHSAAARGNVLTGGTAKALDSYAQDYASNEYGNVYNRALTGFSTAYNQYNNDQNTQFNRLAALSGIGQTSANNLTNAGQAASNNVSSNLLSTGNALAQQTNNAAAATASGYAKQGDIWGQGISGLGNNLGNLYALQGNKYGIGSPYVVPTFNSGVQTSPINSYSYEPDYSKMLG